LRNKLKTRDVSREKWQHNLCSINALNENILLLLEEMSRVYTYMRLKDLRIIFEWKISLADIYRDFSRL
jgi:hypothetical protein